MPVFNPQVTVAQVGLRTTSTFFPYGQVTQDYAVFVMNLPTPCLDYRLEFQDQVAFPGSGPVSE